MVPVAELCAAYGISRKTGYQFLARYATLGSAGLADQSRRPHRSPAALDPVLLQRLLEAHHHHPPWGPRKLLRLVGDRWPDARWPVRSTVARCFQHLGLVTARRRVRRPGPAGPSLAPLEAPNAVWTTDYKGQFKLGDRQYCFPLTVADGYSRMLLACQALTSTKLVEARPIFERLFRAYGLPRRIRSDNGVPFATQALGRLSSLAVWWIRLGILPDLTEPGSPHQNGRHERMHKDLKADATRPAAPSLGAQQPRFDAFRRTFNEVRPHEALGQCRPATLYMPSDRLYVPQLRPITYPEHFEIRRVSTNGGIRWHKRWVNVSHIVATLPVGLEPLASGTWNVFFGPVHLGWLDERDYRIHDRRGRTVRERHLSPIR